MSQKNGGNTGMSVCIRCTYPGCTCSAFQTTTDNVRQCNNCRHGWVPHALDKMGIVYQWDMRKFEQVTYDNVFDIASLVLFGTHGIPFRLHVCLLRLIAYLDNDQAVRITDQFDWSWEEFSRGCKIVNPDETLRSSWIYATLTDETMILGHFLKYKPTQVIATKFLSDLTEQKKEDNPYLHVFNQKPDSGLQSFFSMQNQQKSPVQLPSSSAAHSGLQQHSPPGIPVPNGKAVVFPSANPHQRTMDIVHQDNGGGSTLLFRGPIQVRQGQQETSQTFIINSATPGNGASSSQQSPIQPHIPGKRKLQPKPAAILAPVKLVSDIVAQMPLPLPTPSKIIPKSERHSMDGSSGTGSKSTQKKSQRVHCLVCDKTFCDKGALKIHYSAVHLKEMHRCTVRGCNMMFSSRRSRNRHSSNGNPRLHSNLFAPRRGGILATDDEVPAQEEHMVGITKFDELSDDDNEYDEVDQDDSSSTKASLDASDSPDESIGKLVIEERGYAEIDSEPKAKIRKLDAVMEKDTRGSLGNLTISTKHSMAIPVPQLTHVKAEELSDISLSLGLCNEASEDHNYGAEDPSDEDAYSRESESVSGVVVSVVRDERGKIIVPEDPENPCRCLQCGKIFKNHFTVRTHYMNVHLRLMHKCTVPGCLLEFPSVRSRDRHSQNQNLHSKQSLAPMEDDGGVITQ